MKIRLLAALIALGSLSAAAAPAMAQQAPLASSATGAVLTPESLRQELSAVPPQRAAATLENTQLLRQVAENVLIRHIINQRDDAKALAEQPEIALDIEAAREKVILNAWIADFDRRNTPTAEQAEALARQMFLATPEQYRVGEQVELSHILVRGEPEEARAKAADLLEQLRAGADFEALAREHSEDPGSAARGGALGAIQRGQTVPPFEEAAFALTEVGQLSELVESQFGFHIIRLDNKIEAGVPPFETVREQIIAQIQQDAIQKARLAFLGELQAGMNFDDAALEGFAKAELERLLGE